MKRSSGEQVATIDGCLFRVVDAERVEAVCERMPAEEDLVDTADVFGLLSDPRRLRLLLALLDGELCVCDLAAVTGMSESATSHALRLLRAHRVVSTRRDGRMVYYRLDDAHVRMLLDLAVAHTEHTDAIHPERGQAERGVAAGAGSSAEARRRAR
jgi:ArsR family transcriptional regulator, lead/cadmium/zinc/bismuth-responsive transcriptional repressor